MVCDRDTILTNQSDIKSFRQTVESIKLIYKNNHTHLNGNLTSLDCGEHLSEENFRSAVR